MSGLLKLLLMIIIVAAAIGGRFYSNYEKKNSVVVTLEADNSPTKKKPESPGGMVIPNSDSLVYEKLKSGALKEQVATIVQGPEEPIEITKTGFKNNDVHSIDDILANLEKYEDQLLEDKSLEKAAQEEQGVVMPTDLKKTDSKEAEESEKQKQNLDSDLNIIKAEDDRYQIEELSNINDQENKGFKVQIAAALSVNSAKKKWLELKKRHGKALNKASFVNQKVSGKNERIFYLVMGGYYPSLNEAKSVCRQLSRRNQHCIVVRPSK